MGDDTTLKIPQDDRLKRLLEKEKVKIRETGAAAVVPERTEVSAEENKNRKKMVEYLKTTIGMPEHLAKDYVNQNDIQSKEQLAKKLAQHGMIDIKERGLLRRIFGTDEGDIERLLEKFEGKETGQDEKNTWEAALAGAIWCATRIKENLKKEGITGEKADEIIHDTIFNYAAASVKGTVYTEGEDKEVNLPFILFVGTTEMAIHKTGTAANVNVEQLKKEFDAAVGSALTGKSASEIYENLRKNGKQTSKIILATAVALSEAIEKKEYKAGEMATLTDEYEKIVKGMYGRIESAIAYVEKINPDFTGKIRSKLDEKKEVEDLEGYFLFKIAETAATKPGALSRKDIDKMMEEEALNYVMGNAENFVIFDLRWQMKGEKHISRINEGGQRVVEQLAYVRSSDFEKYKKLRMELLEIILNVGTLDETTKKVAGWQGSVLGEYKNALKKDGIEVKSDWAALILKPEQIMDMKRNYGEEWENKALGFAQKALTHFNITLTDLMSWNMDNIKSTMKKSQFYVQMNAKGHKEDEIVWAALNLVSSFTETYSNYEEKEAEQLIAEALKGVKVRKEAAKEIDALLGKVGKKYRRQAEKELMGWYITQATVMGLDEPYRKAYENSLEAGAEYLGLKVGIEDAQKLSDPKVSNEEKNKIVQKNLEMLKKEVGNSDFGKALLAKGCNIETAIFAAYGGLGMVAELGVAYGSKNAKEIMRKALEGIERKEVLLEKAEKETGKKLDENETATVVILASGIVNHLGKEVQKQVEKMPSGQYRAGNWELTVEQGTDVTNENIDRAVEIIGMNLDDIENTANVVGGIKEAVEGLKEEEKAKRLASFVYPVAVLVSKGFNEQKIRAEIEEFAKGRKKEDADGEKFAEFINAKHGAVALTEKTTIANAYKYDKNKKVGAGGWVIKHWNSLTTEMFIGSGLAYGMPENAHNELRTRGLIREKGGKVTEKFDANKKLFLENEPGKKVEVGIPLFLAALAGGDRNYEYINKALPDYKNLQKTMTHEKIEQLRKAYDSVYDSIWQGAESITKTYAKGSEKRLKELSDEFFIAGLARIKREYGLNIEDINNLVQKGGSVKIKRGDLSEITSKTFKEQKNKTYEIWYAEDGRKEKVGEVAYDKNGKATAALAGAAKEEMDVKFGIGGHFYISLKGNENAVEAFMPAIYYKQRCEVFKKPKKFFRNNDPEAELTFLNLTAKWNPYKITFTRPTEVPKEGGLIPSFEPETNPIGIDRAEVPEEMGAPGKPRARKPIRQQFLKVPEAVPPIMIPPFLSTMVERRTVTEIAFAPALEQQAEFAYESVGTILEKKYGYTNYSTATEDQMQTACIELAQRYSQQIGELVQTGYTRFYLYDGAPTTNPAPNGEHIEILITGVSGQTYNIEMRDKDGAWIVRGSLNQTTREFTTEKMRALGFITLPLLHVANVAKVVDVRIDFDATMKLGVPLELARKGDFLVPNRIGQGNLQPLFPLTLATQPINLGRGWWTTAYLGGVFGEGITSPIGGVSVGKTFYMGGEATLSLQAGFGMSGKDPSPFAGVTANWSSFILGGGYMPSTKTPFFDVGYWRIMLRLMFAPIAGQWAVIPDVIWTDDQNRRRGVVSTPLQILGSVPRDIGMAITERGKKGVRIYGE